MTSREEHRDGMGWLTLCWALALLWFISSLWAALPGEHAPEAEVLQAVLFLLFVVAHAPLSYGWRGFTVYALIACAISFASEAASVNYGFPFGFFTHNVAGVKAWGVPLYIPLGYAVLGWPAWVIARLIVRNRPMDAAGHARFATPLVAAFVLTGYDFPFDPIGATVRGTWIYRDPSGYFGVPLANYLGWLINAWVFYQLFALVEDRFASPRPAVLSRPGYWLLPCLVWAASALQFPIRYLGAPAGTVTVGDRVFVIADVYEAATIAALLTMVFAALIAAIRAWSGANWQQR